MLRAAELPPILACSAPFCAAPPGREVRRRGLWPCAARRGCPGPAQMWVGKETECWVRGKDEFSLGSQRKRHFAINTASCSLLSPCESLRPYTAFSFSPSKPSVLAPSPLHSPSQEFVVVSPGQVSCALPLCLFKFSSVDSQPTSPSHIFEAEPQTTS